MNNCQVIACFQFLCTNIGTTILIKAWVGSWRKSGIGNVFNVAPSPKYNGLTSGVSNAIIHNKNIYTLGEAKVLLVEAKNCKFLLIKNNKKQPQNNKQKVERIF